MKYQDISTNEQFPKTMTIQAQPNGAYSDLSLRTEEA